MSCCAQYFFLVLAQCAHHYSKTLWFLSSKTTSISFVQFILMHNISYVFGSSCCLPISAFARVTAICSSCFLRFYSQYQFGFGCGRGSALTLFIVLHSLVAYLQFPIQDHIKILEPEEHDLACVYEILNLEIEEFIIQLLEPNSPNLQQHLN